MLRLILGIILAAGLAACSSPEPRGVANPGVASGRATAPNTNYYTGSDPDYQRGGARSNKGGP